MSETIYYPTATRLVNSNTTVTANATIYQDLTSQGAYLTPSPSNAAVIVQWMTRLTDSFASDAICGQPFWSNIAPLLTSNVAGPWSGTPMVIGPDGRIWSFGTNADNRIYNFNPYTNRTTSYTSGASVGNGIIGALVLPDGRIFFPPFFSQSLYTLNPVTGVFTSYLQPAGWPNGANCGGGCLMVDGNVWVNPYGVVGNALVFNTSTNTVSNLVSTLGTNGYLGCTTDPTGNVVAPNLNGGLGIYNPYNGQFSTVSTASGYWGCKVLPTGNVICYPYNNNFIGEYNPFTRTFSQMVTTGAGNGNFREGTLLPNGIFALQNGSQLGLYNYKSKTFTSVSFPFGLGSAACLNIDGRLFFNSYPSGSNVSALIASTRPVPPEFCMHPFFNRS
jgi:hypothetical protein